MTYEQLYRLETKLLDAEVRASREQVAELLADDFLELGSSGQALDKIAILDSLEEDAEVDYELSNFSVASLASDVKLLTYALLVQPGDGGPERGSLRSSIWVFRQGRWLLRFHQGTPLDGGRKVPESDGEV